MNLGENEIRSLNALSAVSRVEAKDCLIGEKTISFVVNTGDVGPAIGKNGSHVKKLEEVFNKKIEIVEYKEKPDAFLAAAFPNVRLQESQVREEDGHKTLFVRADAESRKKLLGAPGKFRRMREFLSRQFGIDEVKI
jgi:N utilization substance protein A